MSGRRSASATLCNRALKKFMTAIIVDDKKTAGKHWKPCLRTSIYS